MSQARKRFEAMRGNPRNDWSIGDIQMVCREFGLSCRVPTRGDHYVISHSSRSDILTIPAHRPIKPVYVKQFVRFVDAVEGGEHG